LRLPRSGFRLNALLASILASSLHGFAGNQLAGLGSGPTKGSDTFTMKSGESAEEFSRRIGPPKLTRVRAWDDTGMAVYDKPAYPDRNFELDGTPVVAKWNKIPVIVAFYPNIGFNQGAVCFCPRRKR
jgi:hypothetical protein